MNTRFLKFKWKFVFSTLGILTVCSAFAQNIVFDNRREKVYDSGFRKKINAEKDLLDFGREIVHKGSSPREEKEELSNKMHFSAVPAAGYTLQTGFAGVVSANAGFFTTTNANYSSLLTSFTYTVRNQIIIPFQANIWTGSNKYNIILDWRYLKFPSPTYGLGNNTTIADGYLIDYSTVHLHQTILRTVFRDMYLGLGYKIDYYWNIKELDAAPNSVTDFENYGFNQKEFASGFTFNFLYDTRKSSINPQEGMYANVVYRPNLTLFGNTATWRSLILDYRKYFNVPANTENVLSFWSYNWFTLSGKAPYLMLPNTGGDPFSNTGRGYIQGRYRGTNMIYAESEYRFSITGNGLIGGVVFANAESFSMSSFKNFDSINPAWGVGLRVKLNKFSRTNIAIDYGFGVGGSQGVFVNLGEVF